MTCTVGDYVTLTDGGVYENLGANPIFREERNALDHALISDAETAVLTRHSAARLTHRIETYAPELKKEK